ncbi:hypothetical protein [Lachnoclostridium phytofermentans]|uniref:hypothetical protein n=1 Tax=Lachnoclostridium phytofermentans TaxID=66219 RepID=UPI0002D6A400|nr:hypothetical protein [Lachnoclostridium phytofermentans]
MNRTDIMVFSQKMMEAKKMEVEALMYLLPEQTQDHMKVIGKELESMIKECFVVPEGTQQKKSKKASTSGTRKVDID